MPGWIGGFFKVALGAFGPSPSTERFSGLVANTVENEPLFMCLAVAVATLGTPGEVRDRILHVLMILVSRANLEGHPERGGGRVGVRGKPETLPCDSSHF